eukprot:14285875-Ditylum_brightwellii.AAC.1
MVPLVGCYAASDPNCSLLVFCLVTCASCPLFSADHVALCSHVTPLAFHAALVKAQHSAPSTHCAFVSLHFVVLADTLAPLAHTLDLVFHAALPLLCMAPLTLCSALSAHITLLVICTFFGSYVAPLAIFIALGLYTALWTLHTALLTLHIDLLVAHAAHASLLPQKLVSTQSTSLSTCCLANLFVHCSAVPL